MVKHVLKAFGVLTIVFLTSATVTGQTTFTITNDNADCPIDYKIFHTDTGCSGTLITGSCSGSSVCNETIPAGDRVVKIKVTDPTSGNSATVYYTGCGSATGSYTNCDSVTSNVEYIISNDELHVYE